MTRANVIERGTIVRWLAPDSQSGSTVFNSRHAIDQLTMKEKSDLAGIEPRISRARLTIPMF
jgi:hypothetical protein